MWAGYRPDHPVFQGIDLRMTGPGLTHLRGSNGSGKSTFVELVSGYLRPFAGRVEVCGLRADSGAARDRRRVCRTDIALYPRMTVRDHLALASRLHRTATGTLAERAQTYGLTLWLDRAADELSAGNARKLWIILCTAGEFDVMVLDEPFNAVDDLGIESLAAELHTWRSRALVVLAAHALPSAIEVDRQVDLPAVLGNQPAAGSLRQTNSAMIAVGGEC